MISKLPLRLVVVSGFFLALDRFLKWQALHSWQNPRLWGEGFGWEPFLNNGIAFGIALPRLVIILFTLFIVSAVLYLFYYHLELAPDVARGSAFVGLTLIITGAISNLTDRVYYGVTIDYLRIFNSLVNCADALIVVGFVLYFASLKPRTVSA